jgi:hypothetical protein
MEFRRKLYSVCIYSWWIAPGVTNIFFRWFCKPNIRLVAGDEYGQIYGSKYQRAGQMLISPTTGLPLASLGVEKIGTQTLILQWVLPIPLTKTLVYTFCWHSWRWWPILRNIADVQRNGVALETAEFPRFADNVTWINHIFMMVFMLQVQMQVSQIL